ncbi:hypothetical protein GCM10010390_06850 [Streptomyces mordarskii]|uniref:Uncharacterized protein n=1 Tax=Streptomyces mordarskii TaxID=1226758 RepID=A0ABN1BVM2_9ACTN
MAWVAGMVPVRRESLERTVVAGWRFQVAAARFRPPGARCPFPAAPSEGPLPPVRGLPVAFGWAGPVRGEAEDGFGQLGADVFDLAAGGVPFGDDRPRYGPSTGRIAGTHMRIGLAHLCGRRHR